MAATVDVTAATFPLNITIFNATITSKGDGGQRPWETPLLLTFSEVDLDDENDPDMEFWVFCLLMILALFALCGCICIIWCVICDGECCCDGSASEAPPPSRTYSKELQEWDVETGRQDPRSVPTVIQGTPVVGDIDPKNKDPEFVGLAVLPLCNAPVVEGYRPAAVSTGAQTVPAKQEETWRHQA